MTLIELMVAVAIIGLLAAVALPSYTEYVRRGHRADARAGLLQAQQWLERSATATGSYPTTAQFPATLKWTDDTSKRYTIGVDVAVGGGSYTLTATRKADGHTTDKCGDFTLTNQGVRGANNLASGVTAEDCWNR